MENFEKAFKLPLKVDRIGSYIWDKNDNMTAQFLNTPNAKRVKIIDSINTGLGIYKEVFYDIKRQVIQADGDSIILLRGWGYLTGVGGLDLTDDEAESIQDDLGYYLVSQLKI